MPYTNLGASISASGPSAVQTHGGPGGPSEFAAAIRGTDSKVYLFTAAAGAPFNPGSGWNALPLAITPDAPALIARPNNTGVIFVRGLDDNLWFTTGPLIGGTLGASWDHVTVAGRPVAIDSAPAACVLSDGTVWVACRDGSSDLILLRGFFGGAAFELGAAPAGPPGVGGFQREFGLFAMEQEAILLAVDYQNAVFASDLRASAWTPFVSLGGAAISGASAALSESAAVVYSLGTDSRIYWTRRDGGSPTWSQPWVALDPQLITSKPSVTVSALLPPAGYGTVQQVFARDLASAISFRGGHN